MDSFSLFLLFFSILFVCLTLLFFFRKNSSADSNLPPGSTGWPILGENGRLASLGPEKFFSERMEKYSPDVFKTSLLGEKMAVFCGAAGNKFMFSNENKLLVTWIPRSFTLLFPGDDSSQQEHLQQRFLFHEILKPEALKQFIPLMDSMAREHLEVEWTPFDQVKIHPLSKKYTFALACRLTVSIEGPEEVKRLSEPFALLSTGMYSIPINFPGTPFRRAIRGGKAIRDEILKIIKARRQEMMETKDTAAKDIMSHLLLAKDENGRFLSEKQITNSIASLLVASYDTTSAAITSVLKYLAELPHIYDEVYKEQMEIAKAKGPKELLNWEDIRKMKYSWNVACEALRLTPPAQGAFSETTADFTFGGFTIPKGWKTFWNVYSTHRNAKYFSNPEKFDPSRFEGSGPAPYTFVPFGGGPRMCPGKEYARLEVLVFMHNVVTKFKLEKVIPDEKIIYHGSPAPVNGLPVRLHPHKR